MNGLRRTLLPPLSAAELHAAALSGAAQAQLALGDQSKAEQLLGEVCGQCSICLHCMPAVCKSGSPQALRKIGTPALRQFLVLNSAHTASVPMYAGTDGR